MKGSFFITLLMLFISSSCKEDFKSQYIALKEEKERTDSLLNNYYKSVSVQSAYEKELNKVLKINHLKQKEFQKKTDIYFEFEIYPPFNQARQLFIISNKDSLTHLHKITYNLHRDCNIVTGSKNLDKSCLKTFKKDSFQLHHSEVDTFIKKLDYYEFWNLAEKTYNAHETVIYDGFSWSMKGIKGSNFHLPFPSNRYEHKIYRQLPQYYNSVYEIGKYIMGLKKNNDN